MWELWRRHKKKFYITLGIFGSGYFFYKLYDAHQKQIRDLEKELAIERENEELVKVQMQVHFENIQRIADTITLPHVIHNLSTRVEEELDIVHLTEKLMKGKDQPNTLSSSEKLELWDRLKLLSFTKAVLSIWAMTTLSLYIRVQVNILGRHMYIDTARGLGTSHLLDEADLIDRNDQQQFLSAVDFLSDYGMSTLLSNMQAAVAEVLREKQLKDIFTTSILHETIVLILDRFMSMGSPHHWVDYLMPEDLKYRSAAFSSRDGQNVSEVPKFDLLMVETRAVLSSAEFQSIVDVSLKTLVDELMQDVKARTGGINLSGVPLAKLIPQIAQLGPVLLEEPSRNRFINIIRNLPVVEVFFTLLYSNMPPH